jgi:hypothetical protein
MTNDKVDQVDVPLVLDVSGSMVGGQSREMYFSFVDDLINGVLRR